MDYEPVKIIGNNTKNFNYKLGINVNDEEFVADGKCLGNGLYFTDQSLIHNYIDGCYGDSIAHIKLLDNENIWIENAKCKTNKFEITKIEKIEDYINNLSEEKKLKLVKSDCDSIRFITNPSEQLQLEAVKNKYWSIFWIKNPTEQVQLKAVEQNFMAIKNINFPSEKVQLLAIKKSNRAYCYIHNPSMKLYLHWLYYRNIYY